MPPRQLCRVRVIHYKIDRSLRQVPVTIWCTFTDGLSSNESTDDQEYKFNLNDILGMGPDFQVVPGGTNFFFSRNVEDLEVGIYPNQHGASNLNMCYTCYYYKSFGSKTRHCGTSYTFDLQQIFDFTSTMTLKPRAALLSMQPTEYHETLSLQQKKLFDGQALSPNGVFSVYMRDIQGKTNRAIALNFELDKVLGLSDRRLTVGQTGFFSRGLTRGIHLDSQDGWTLHYRVYPGEGESDWSNDRTYDLSRLFQLGDRLQLKHRPDLGHAKPGPTTKEEQARTDRNNTKPSISAKDRDTPPKYQPEPEAKNQELATIKKALDANKQELAKANAELSVRKSEVEQLRRAQSSVKEEVSLNAKLLQLKIQELESLLRIARSTAREEIASLKRTNRRLHRELGDDDDDDDEDED